MTADRAALVRSLGIDPDRHPDGGLCEWDPSTREWRVEVFTAGGRRAVLRRWVHREPWQNLTGYFDVPAGTRIMWRPHSASVNFSGRGA